MGRRDDSPRPPRPLLFLRSPDGADEVTPKADVRHEAGLVTLLSFIMRTLPAYLLLLVGLLIVLCGIGWALFQLIEIYGAAMNDPLAQPEGAEADVSRRMLLGVAVGASGIIPFLIGMGMLRRARRRTRASHL